MDETLADLRALIAAKEDEHLEFKEARSSFEFDDLVKYCAALSNEGGGKIVLGVTNKRPRRIVGTQAFQDLERTKLGLYERLRMRVEVQEVMHPDGRVLIFTAPARFTGTPVQYEGRYWMRTGESLVPMTPDMLRRIFDEAGPEFTAEVCPMGWQGDLDPAAVDQLRSMWHRRSGNANLLSLPPRQ